jgi:hypothetical protein
MAPGRLVVRLGVRSRAGTVWRVCSPACSSAVGVDSSVSEVNGEPAVLGHRNGNLLGVMVLVIVDGQIAAMRSVANPDKLVFLARQTASVSHSEGLSRLSG